MPGYVAPHCQEYRLLALNTIPHLDTPERRNAITFA